MFITKMITLNYKSVLEQPFYQPWFLRFSFIQKHTTKCAKMRLNSNKLAMGVQARITNPQNMQTMFLYLATLAI